MGESRSALSLELKETTDFENKIAIYVGAMISNIWQQWFPINFLVFCFLKMICDGFPLFMLINLLLFYSSLILDLLYSATFLCFFAANFTNVVDAQHHCLKTNNAWFAVLDYSFNRAA